MIKDLLQSISKVYIAYGATDFRKQIDSLCIEVKSKFHLNPYEKAAFIFCNKKRNSIKGKRTIKTRIETSSKIPYNKDMT